METIKKFDAIKELTDREYETLVNMFKEESKSAMLPLVSSGLGGFDKMTIRELQNYYFVIYDEDVNII